MTNCWRWKNLWITRNTVTNKSIFKVLIREFMTDCWYKPIWYRMDKVLFKTFFCWLWVGKNCKTSWNVKNKAKWFPFVDKYIFLFFGLNFWDGIACSNFMECFSQKPYGIAYLQNFYLYLVWIFKWYCLINYYRTPWFAGYLIFR